MEWLSSIKGTELLGKIESDRNGRAAQLGAPEGFSLSVHLEQAPPTSTESFIMWAESPFTQLPKRKEKCGSSTLQLGWLPEKTCEKEDQQQEIAPKRGFEIGCVYTHTHTHTHTGLLQGFDPIAPPLREWGCVPSPSPGWLKVWRCSTTWFVVQLLSHIRLFATPWKAEHQASLSSTIYRNLLNFMSLRQCYHLTALSFATLFFCLQPFPASSFFPMSWLFTSGSQSLGASASVLPVNIKGGFPWGLTGWISLLSKGFSRVFSNTTVQKHQFFGFQLSL